MGANAAGELKAGPDVDIGLDDEDQRAAPAPPRPSIPRMASPDGLRRVVVKGRAPGGWRDIYHGALTVSWGWFALIAFAIYLGSNLVFAAAYALDPNGIAGPGRGFLRAFFFSVQTMGTIGYGALTPGDLWGNLVVTFESFYSLGLTAVATGVIFARVSRPTARVMFSRVALISLNEGRPTFMFRAANQRRNQILEAQVSLSLVHQVVTAEGQVLRRIDELKPVRARSPMFALTWTVMHVIDEASPLHGYTRERLEADQAEIVVVLSGVDETFADRVHARYSYVAEDILYDHAFADVLSIAPDGQRVVDYGVFHDAQPRSSLS